jgi:hypothetical protein
MLEPVEKRQKNLGFTKPIFIFLVLIMIFGIVGVTYLILHTGQSTEYTQGSPSNNISNGVSTTSVVNGSGGNAIQSNSPISSSPLVLNSISPATTTDVATITINGKGFSIEPSGQAQIDSSAWQTSDHVIVWLTRDNQDSSSLSSNATTTVLNLQNATTTASTTDSAVLWEGNPSPFADTSISTSIGRFLCRQVNSVVGAGTINISACPDLFAVTPGIYALTVSIPDLNLTSNPLQLTITGPSLSFQRYANKQYGYSLNYPDDLALMENVSYPPAPSSGIVATVFDFPKTYYPGGTITEAGVDVAVTSGLCSVWPGGGQPNFSFVGHDIINGVPFMVRQVADAGAGNLYLTTEYSTQKGKSCYRLVLYSHSGNPAMYTSNANQISQYTQANTEADSMLMAVFSQIVRSFMFSVN